MKIQLNGNQICSLNPIIRSWWFNDDDQWHSGLSSKSNKNLHELNSTCERHRKELVRRHCKSCRDMMQFLMIYVYDTLYPHFLFSLLFFFPFHIAVDSANRREWWSHLLLLYYYYYGVCVESSARNVRYFLLFFFY